MRIKATLTALTGAAAGLCLMFGAAHADVIYNWTYVDNPAADSNWGAGIAASGSGQLTVAGGLVTGLTGTLDGIAITGLLPLNTSLQSGNTTVYLNNDNQMPLDGGGIGFSLATPDHGGTDVLFWYWSYGGTDSVGFINGYGYGAFTATPATTGTPEPASLGLLGAAVAGLLTTRRRRRAA